MSVRPQESPPARTARILLRAAGAAFSLPERLPRVSKGRTGSGAGMDLVWRVRTAGGRLVGEPAGRVDETTWEAFSAHLTAAVREASAAGAPLILDLSQLDYMSSRGLRALTIARREAGDQTSITLAAPNARMREIFAISRYDKLFAIVDDVDSDA